MTPAAEQPRYRATAGQAILVALFLGPIIGLVGSSTCQAQLAPTSGDDVTALRAALLDCETLVDSLLQERARIRRDSDRWATERERALAGSAKTEELGLLARLADLSAEEDRVSGILRSRQAACETLADHLQVAIEKVLAATNPALPPGAARDSLEVLRATLATRNQPVGRIDVPLPRATPEDGPEELSYRAQLARDLADRLRRWSHYVSVQRQSIEAEARLDRELSNLLQDEELFGDGILQGSSAPVSQPPSWRTAPWKGGVQEQIAALKSQARIEGEEWTAPALLAALEEWLQLRRAALLERATSLEREANVRGTRPEVNER